MSDTLTVGQKIDILKMVIAICPHSEPEYVIKTYRKYCDAVNNPTSQMSEESQE